MHTQSFLNLLRQNGRRETKLYLARTDNLNDSVAPDMNNMASKLYASATKAMKKTTP